MVAEATSTSRNGTTHERTTAYPPPGPQVGWFMPQPLWPEMRMRPALRSRRDTPQLLRFAGDAFMDELTSVLKQGLGLDTYVAQAESWQREDAGLSEDGADKPGQLKLFQPGHNRFYLVAGALACKIPGVPDRTVDAAGGESAFFVLRRLHDNVEYGWSTGVMTAPDGITGAVGPYLSAPEKGWAPVPQPGQRLLLQEERFPLFPLTYGQKEGRRRLLAGLIPVAARETYQAGARFSPAPAIDAEGSDPRPLELEARVIAPLQAAADWYRRSAAEFPTGTPERRQMEHGMAFALLDLMELLKRDLRSVFDGILATGLTEVTPGDKTVQALLATELTAGAAEIRLGEVLAALESQRGRIIAVPGEEDTGLGADEDVADLGSELGRVWQFQMQAGHVVAAALESLFGRLEPASKAALLQPYVKEIGLFDPAGVDYPEQPKLEDGARYVIRLVYERPACRHVTLSLGTRPFQLASFFDPDAPIRPVRIRMPVDTSVAGLRKYGKGVSVMISDQLQKQIGRIKGLEALMNGDLNEEPSIDLGMICSFSIPIITICALILLMIIVSLLNMVFMWLPMFKICIPISSGTE